MSATPPLRAQRPGFPGYLAPDDGNVDENPDNNCNWACYSCAIQALGGPAVPPDHLKDHDHFYGQGQVGPSYDGNNVFEDTTYGVVQTLKSLAGSAREADIKAQLAAGNYVQVLIPGDWNNPTPSSTSSHYVLLYADDGAGYWAMNPWDGTYMYRSYARWALLDARGGDYLIYSKGATVTDITPLYTVHADGSATFKANGAVIGSGFYATVKALGIAAPPMYPHEIARGAGSAETYMPFGDGNGEAVTLYYDGTKVIPNYWLGHGIVSLEQARAAAVSATADMKSQRDQLSATLAQLQKAYETATQQSAAKDGQIAQLTQQVAQLQAQIAAGDPQSQDAKAALESLRAYFAKYPAPPAPAA